MKDKIKLIIVAGARPNFPKIAPIIRAMNKTNRFKIKLVHTGQHYDKNMSESFFKQLEIPEPNLNLNIHGGSHAEQVGKIMIEFEKIVQKNKPNYILVVGDVNSTVAAAIVAKKEQIKLIHVEAGLRSFDETMPEEINRLITDRITDIYFVTEPSGVKNLENEGVSENKIFEVGHVMIDTLAHTLPKIKEHKQTIIDKNIKHCVVTIHRPSNVDNEETLQKILLIFKKLQHQIKIVWPIHPRMKKQIDKFQLNNLFNQLTEIKFTEPLDYKTFMKLILTSEFIITDSGGIQEETTWLQIPCLTLRDNTERPITITQGSNTLIAGDYAKLELKINEILSGKYKKGEIPKLWDGKSSERITQIIINDFEGEK